MAQEFDAAALESVESLSARMPVHTRPIGAPCPNCGVALAGAWCHACGQSSEDFHRSSVKLAREAVDGLLDLDSRVWRTLPNLCLRPARLTRSYLDGHRIAQVPPFRLFLIMVVLVFLVAGFDHGTKVVIAEPSPTSKDPVVHFFASHPNAAVQNWLEPRARAAEKDPERFTAALVVWAQRLAILSLPLSALLLGAMFFWRPGVYMFDHLIFSMHSLSFQGLLLAACMMAMSLDGLFGWLLLLAPVHLFAHLKGTYGLGVFGTLARMLGLFVGSLVALGFAFVALILIGFIEVAP